MKILRLIYIDLYINYIDFLL